MEEEKNYLDELAYKIANDNSEYYYEGSLDDFEEDCREESYSECYSSAVDMAKEIFNAFENDPDKFYRMLKESKVL